ncbi:MAG: hypothetical protein ACI835_004518, partial [Planctomycetota bacterium]
MQGPEPLARPGQAQVGGHCSLTMPMEGDLLSQSELCANASRSRNVASARMRPNICCQLLPHTTRGQAGVAVIRSRGGCVPRPAR